MDLLVDIRNHALVIGVDVLGIAEIDGQRAIVLARRDATRTAHRSAEYVTWYYFGGAFDGGHYYREEGNAWEDFYDRHRTQRSSFPQFPGVEPGPKFGGSAGNREE
jgi:hypothetical protein